MSETPEATRALVWFAQNNPARRTDRGAPRHSMWSRLEVRGLIVRTKFDLDYKLNEFRLSETGRNVLKEAGWL